MNLLIVVSIKSGYRFVAANVVHIMNANVGRCRFFSLTGDYFQHYGNNEFTITVMFFRSRDNDTYTGYLSK